MLEPVPLGLRELDRAIAAAAAVVWEREVLGDDVVKVVGTVALGA